MVKRLLHIFLLATLLIPLLTSLPASAIDTATRIFDHRFSTLKTSVEDNFMSPPIIRINTHDRLIINFDEIGEENSYLEYRLIHCNADWQPSQLMDSEIVDSFNSQRIEDFEYSFSTYVHFVNYQIVLPNEDMKILHSGNYLLQVYDPDEPDETLLQTRFQVSEALVDITGAVTTRTDRGHNAEWQQLALEVTSESMGNYNPYQDLVVEVSRNMEQSTLRRLKTPMVNGNRMIFEHQPELIFPASNEFRRFESVSNAFPGLHVDGLRYVSGNYHVWLVPDRPRAYLEYSFDRTQHGRFKVREYNATNSDIAADYITVHFTLEMPEMKGTEVYVDGEFCHGIYDDFNRLTYDAEQGAYTAEILLKQGAYNYQYVTRPEGSTVIPTPTRLEGDKYETGNEYNVTVYYRPPGARADRLVGTKTIDL